MTTPENPQPPGGPSEDKLRGRGLALALLLAGSEFMIYWMLVFLFPEVMIAASVILAGISFYFSRREVPFADLAEEMDFSDRDVGLLRKYTRAWIFISLYGTGFAIYLLLRAG